MRTTLNINRELLEEAAEITGESNLGRVVDKALEDLVRRQKIEELIALAGKIDIVDNLDQLERAEIEEMGRRE
jgi:hypothetical protein